jgi:sugar/nucleoside kinase (ribokinase family)
MQKSDIIQNLVGVLKLKNLNNFSVVVGFDGFVDEIISVVLERRSLNDWSAVPTIHEFGEIILAAAGKSSLREIIIHKVDPGGCAVNMGDGLQMLGIEVNCFATLGKPMHPAFFEFAKKCKVCNSWGSSPGRTLAFEFSDGKLMFSSVTQLADFKPESLDNELADGTYLNSCSKAQLIALTDWTLYPHMTDCWIKLKKDVYSKLSHKPYFYFDLVDPSSRSLSDVSRMLDILSSFQNHGPTILGLNLAEARVVGKALEIQSANDSPDTVKALAAQIRQRLNVDQVVIHSIKFAVVAEKDCNFYYEGPFCEKPKKSTGAGDRFNAGYIAGLLLKLDPVSRLALASATSGFFVRHAKSPTLVELENFLENWANNRLD